MQSSLLGILEERCHERVPCREMSLGIPGTIGRAPDRASLLSPDRASEGALRPHKHVGLEHDRLEVNAFAAEGAATRVARRLDGGEAGHSGFYPALCL